MDWIVLVCAGLCEVGGVVGLNLATTRKNVGSFIVLGVFFVLSFGLLSLAMRTLPLGVSYAVWTGIGAAGGTIIGMLFWGESRDWRRIACIVAIIAAVVGLRLFT